jgi:hypothetical protein
VRNSVHSHETLAKIAEFMGVMPDSTVSHSSSMTSRRSGGSWTSLSAEGCRIIEAERGGEIIGHTRRDNPDIVFSGTRHRRIGRDQMVEQE